MPATLEVDLSRVVQNGADVAAATGVPLLAVIKADAYGLGAAAVADVLCDLGDRLAGFYVFDADEATSINLFGRTGRWTVALHGGSADPADYRAAGIRPVVWTVGRAATLAAAHPVLSVDTGQQRFACPPGEVEHVRRAGDCREAMTHATRPEQAEQFRRLTDGWHPYRHAAGSALLGAPSAWFDAVRPGLTLYRGAVRVTARLLEVRDAVGPAGYTGFCVARFGVIPVGYRDGLRPGPCRVGGRVSRVLEVGMQTAFVEVGTGGRAGDEVVLLGSDSARSTRVDGDGELSESDVATAWRTSEQEVLVRLSTTASRVTGRSA